MPAGDLAEQAARIAKRPAFLVEDSIKIIMRTSFTAAAILALIALQSGCSQLPPRPSWAKWNEKSQTTGLPSPDATIAASEKQPAAKSSAKSPAKKSSQDSAVAGEISRGKALEAAGKPDKARKVFEAALRANPESMEAAQALGIHHDKQGRHADAEQCFLVALHKHPRNPELLSDLGYCYFLQGRLDSAESALVKATTLDPTNPRYHNNLGRVLGFQRRYDDAHAQFALAGSKADAFYNMANVFAAQDLNDEAKGCFQEALAADPSYQPAREALASFEEFDRLPPEQQQEAPALAKQGIRYVPYIEGAAADGNSFSSEVRQASATAPIAPVNALPANRHAGRATRNLQTQSRGMLGSHMQSERNAQTAANAAAMSNMR